MTAEIRSDDESGSMKLAYWMLLLPGVALAADPTLQQCRAIPDAAARLACYDALPLPAVPPAVAAPAPEAPTQFGLVREAPPVVELPSIESTIPGHFDGWYPNRRIRLANGQVWQVADGSTRFYDLDNPKVTIRRGVLGAFYLDLSVDNRSIRVRRVE